MAQQNNDDGNGLEKFLFKASATALSGSIRQPYFQDLGEHAAVSTYAGSAGHSTARNENFVLGRELAYHAAHSEVHAWRDGHIRHTQVVSTIERLDIGGRLTADLIVSRFESRYDSKTYPDQRFPRILPMGSRFVNLRVDGKEIQPPLSPAFNFSDKDRDEFFASRTADDLRFHPGFIPEPLQVPDFGTLFFAEWVWAHPLEQHEQCLTMLRLDLKNEFGACLLMATSKSGGRGWPP